MKKYSVAWKKAKRAWIQDHIRGCERIWKVHYIQYDTEYSKGEYLTKAEALAALENFKSEGVS